MTAELGQMAQMEAGTPPLTHEQHIALMQARADLGHHRISSLPLAGAVVHASQKLKNKINLSSLSEPLKAWRSM